MKDSKFPFKDIAAVAIGEIIVAVLTVLGYLLVSLFTDVTFTYRVITGAVLGCTVTVLNFLFLTLSVNKQIDSFVELRGSREMDDEEAAKFTNKHSLAIQNSIKLSFIIRTVTIFASLIVAFITDWFDPIATVIPLIAYRPVISVSAVLMQKMKPKGEEVHSNGG